jgi:hypothetical protein
MAQHLNLLILRFSLGWDGHPSEYAPKSSRPSKLEFGDKSYSVFHRVTCVIFGLVEVPTFLSEVSTYVESSKVFIRSSDVRLFRACEVFISPPPHLEGLHPQCP